MTDSIIKKIDEIVEMRVAFEKEKLISICCNELNLEEAKLRELAEKLEYKITSNENVICEDKCFARTLKKTQCTRSREKPSDWCRGHSELRHRPFGDIREEIQKKPRKKKEKKSKEEVKEVVGPSVQNIHPGLEIMPIGSPNQMPSRSYGPDAPYL
jgi:hypothetical protein